MARAVDEVEPNQPADSAQQLIIPASGSVTVNGVVGNLTGPAVLDVDFYSFRGKAGDVVTIDIDGGFQAGQRSIDTWVAIFGPGPLFIRKALNDDVPSGVPLDDGSVSRLDSLIKDFRLDADGVWTVAVTGKGVQLGDGAVYTRNAVDAFRGNGDYILTISGVTPSALPISIEVKPGSGEYAPINPKAQGTIPVALLSSADFNALDVKVDPRTLTFGRTGSEQSLRRCGKGGEDVNGDGRPDLVCHFENQLARFSDEDDRGTLRGVTSSGMPFEGHGMLKVVPVKRDE
jgi:hypothetical protein